jgi:hypothetical protein
MTAPKVAQAHQDYVYGAADAGAAVASLAKITPTIVSGDLPLLRVVPRDPEAGTQIFPFQQPDCGRYMNVLSGTRIELAPALVAALARKIAANRRHFPREETLAGGLGVPGLYARLDCFLTAAHADRAADQEWVPADWAKVAIAICEIDDQPAFVGSFRRGGHGAAFGAFARLAAELAELGRPLRLAEMSSDRSADTLDGYPHDDRCWLPDVGPATQPAQVATITRARRFVPGSREFLARWTPSSIFPGATFRDYKGVLGVPRSVDPELGLGVLVQDHRVAREVILSAHRDGLGPVMVKGVFSARKEAAMAVSARSKVRASYYRLNQLRRLHVGEDDGRPYVQQLVLQPTFGPPTLRNLGLRLSAADAKAVLRHPYPVRPGAADGHAGAFAHLPEPGNEARFYCLFRLYFVYLPSEIRAAGWQPRFAGGLMQACTTPMAIHGSNGAITVWVAGPNAAVTGRPVGDDMSSYVGLSG